VDAVGALVTSGPVSAADGVTAAVATGVTAGALDELIATVVVDVTFRLLTPACWYRVDVTLVGTLDVVEAGVAADAAVADAAVADAAVADAAVADAAVADAAVADAAVADPAVVGAAAALFAGCTGGGW